MNKISLLFSLFFALFCGGSCNTQKIMIPDEINIYKLSQVTSSLVRIKCDRVKTVKGVTKRNIKNKKEIKELVFLFADSTNFISYTDTDTADLDSRILIEYISKGKVIKLICWSRTELIQKDDRIYSYNKKIENYLLREKLIIKLDSTIKGY